MPDLSDDTVAVTDDWAELALDFAADSASSFLGKTST